MNGYKEVEHTADIALQVWAEDFYTLLIQAAKGLYALMGVEPTVAPSRQRLFTLPQGNKETILVDFLTELLFLAEEDGLFLSVFCFDDGQNVISVRSTGQKILTWSREIKAVTFHNLNVETTDQGFSATITFDV
ncbi:MAG TPA: archease [Brevefilum sp.]|nr:archease [Brevefilum sp.]HOR19356.1 archease [Brevefilum sp.]HPL69767.1 archease [Brevefilum sp.]